jgi:hypothetical protein
MSVAMDSLTAGGLFPHYDAALEVGEPALKTSDATSAKLMDTPLQARACRPRQILAAAVLAAGTVRLLGGAVDAYNHRVDELNARWRAAKRENFGVGSLTCPEDASEDEIRRVTAIHADRLLDAKLELLSRLENEHQRIRRELDEQIAAATDRLEQGPTDDVLRDLVEASALKHVPTQRKPRQEA